MAEIKKFYEMTFNLRQLAERDSKARKSIQAVKRLRQAVIRYFKREGKVVLDCEVNKEIFKNGNKNIPRRIRVRINIGQNADGETEYRVYFVATNTFKNLIPQKVEEEV